MQVKNRIVKRCVKGIVKCMEWVVEQIYPPCCPFCDTVLKKQDRANRICKKCQWKLVYIAENHCMKCGKPLTDDTEEYCYDCSRHRHFYTQARALLSYQGPAREALYRFKCSNRREYAVFFGSEMCRVLGRWIEHCGADYLVPIPMHDRKQRERGYNQAEVLARVISQQMGIPLADKVLIKTAETLQQKELSAEERRKNLLSVFQISEQRVAGTALSGKTVLLVDDIYTTGATVDAAAEVLLKAGVMHVYVLTAAIGG